MSWCKDPVLILTLSLVFALDQVTKAVVRHSLLLGESIPREGAFRITHTFNTGSAFGLFSDQTLFLILASFVGIAILLLVYRNHPSPSFPLRLSLGMQLGGALGNLVDRLRMGQVTDFIELGFWPVFNLADASIVLGIIIVACLFLFSGSLSVRRRPSPEGVQPAAVYRGHDGWMSPHPNPSPAGGGTDGGYTYCPICDSAMREVPGGWRCWGCGVKEWVEEREHVRR